jgi:hypothetical protein
VGGDPGETRVCVTVSMGMCLRVHACRCNLHAVEELACGEAYHVLTRKGQSVEALRAQIKSVGCIRQRQKANIEGAADSLGAGSQWHHDVCLKSAVAYDSDRSIV